MKLKRKIDNKKKLNENSKYLEKVCSMLETKNNIEVS
jgi:hypothetical protein